MTGAGVDRTADSANELSISVAISAARLETELLQANRFQGMVGRSPLMLELFALIRRVALRPSRWGMRMSIKITSGSTAIARAMHKRCGWPPDTAVPVSTTNLEAGVVVPIPNREFVLSK